MEDRAMTANDFDNIWESLFGVNPTELEEIRLKVMAGCKSSEKPMLVVLRGWPQMDSTKKLDDISEYHVEEVCPHCGKTTKLRPVIVRQLCSHCQGAVFPCSLCKKVADQFTDCNKCSNSYAHETDS